MMLKATIIGCLVMTIALGGTASSQESALQKRPTGQYIAPAAIDISSHLDKFKSEAISKATQYYTPLFAPGPDGKLKSEDRRACLNVEGSCIVGNYLYNYPGPDGVSRNGILFKFGKGTGVNSYNTTNALDPCRTLAADLNVYPIGTVIFIPALKGKVCPQSGKPVDGAFIVGDKGSAISGPGRFDIFTGECVAYSKQTNSCRDAANAAFTVAAGTKFYVIARDDSMAKVLRQQADEFIKQDWQ